MLMIVQNTDPLAVSLEVERLVNEEGAYFTNYDAYASSVIKSDDTIVTTFTQCVYLIDTPKKSGYTLRYRIGSKTSYEEMQELLVYYEANNYIFRTGVKINSVVNSENEIINVYYISVYDLV